MLAAAMNATLTHTVRRLLRPLVRHLIGQGFTWTALVTLLKTLYIEEALARTSGRAPTDSDLSLVTGIHRKDVKRLRTTILEESDITISRGTHIAAQLIGAWVSHESARNADGDLKALPIHSTTELSVESLVKHIKADMRPRAILDDLLRTQAVAIEDDGKVRLLRDAYVPDIPEEKLHFLADNVGDHMAAAFHNLSDQPPFLERALYFDTLSPSVLADARPRIDAAANDMLQTFYRELTPHEAPGPGARRVRLGVYYYEDTPRPLHENSDDAHT